MRRNPRTNNEPSFKQRNTVKEMENVTFFWVYEQPEGQLIPRLRFIGLDSLRDWLNLKNEEFVWAIDTDKSVVRRRLGDLRRVWIKTSLVYFGEFSPEEAIKTMH